MWLHEDHETMVYGVGIKGVILIFIMSVVSAGGTVGAILRRK